MYKYIYIAVSDVAAAIGQNQFKKPSEVALKILREQFHQSDKKLATDTALRTALQINSAAIVELAHSKINNNHQSFSRHLTTDVRQKVEETLIESVAPEQTGKSTVEIIETEMNSIKQLEEKEVDIALTDEQKAICKEMVLLGKRKIDELQMIQDIITELPGIVEAEVSKATGVLMEESIVNQVEVETGWKIKQRNCEMAYLNITIPGNVEFGIKIGGRPDGIVVEEGELIIVEVKNRQNRLFNMIPKYEQVQIQLYLSLFNAKKCHFKENYNGTSRSEIIEYDVAKVQEIKKELIEFATKQVLDKLT